MFRLGGLGNDWVWSEWEVIVSVLRGACEGEHM